MSEERENAMLELSARVVQLEALVKNHSSWLNELENKNKKLSKAHKTLSVRLAEGNIKKGLAITNLTERIEKLETDWEIASIDHDPRTILRDGTALSEIIGLLKGISDQLKRMDA